MPAASHTVCLMLYDYVPLTGVSLAKGAILDSEMHASTTERIVSSISGVWRWELAQSVNSIRVFVSFLVSFIVASQLAEHSTRIPTLPIALSGNTGRCQTYSQVVCPGQYRRDGLSRVWTA